MKKRIELAETNEVGKRKRELQLIINLVQPDPEYQPFIITDEANFFDITSDSKAEIEEKLKFYFKGDLPAPLTTPLWKFIDIVKAQYPGWPDEWPPLH